MTTPLDKPALDRCPACRYSLQGLPSVYRCPECGFEYDDKTLVVEMFDRPWKNPLLGAEILMLMYLALGLSYQLMNATVNFFTWLNLVVFISASVLFFLGFDAFRYPPMVVVSPVGVLLRHGSKVPQVHLWSTITDVTFHPRGKKFGVCFLILGDEYVSLQAYMTTRLRSQSFFLAVKARLAEKAAARSNHEGHETSHG